MRTNFFPYQWHLFNADPASGVDLSLRGAWADYTGRGVTVGIWDDGIERRHWDLREAYDAGLHLRIDGDLHDPYDGANGRHGTSVAGLIAAADNGVGGTGVAPGARIAGVDILSEFNAVDTATSFASLRRFDVTNHSWSFAAPFLYDALDPSWSGGSGAGLAESVLRGRDGLGTINVVSAGNERNFGWHTNVSPLTNAAETIAVAAVGYDGYVSEYSTPGPTLLVSAPSDSWRDLPGIWTTDVRGDDGWSPVEQPRPPFADPDATSTFGGTSAAAPMISGVVALMLEANDGLGWRDVQEILALGARHVGSRVDGASTAWAESAPWFWNGAGNWNGGGMHYSLDYGFGLVDARAAVRLAETWTLRQGSGDRVVAEVADWTGSETIRDGADRPVERVLSVDADMTVESVHLVVELSRGEIADYDVELVSPSGTVAVLAVQTQGVPVAAWRFGAKAFWGEESDGDWTVRIRDGDRDGGSGRLAALRLTIDGEAERADDIHVVTDEFADFARAAFGRRAVIRDLDGGTDDLNAAAVTSDTRVDLAAGTARFDGRDAILRGAFERVFAGDGDDALFGSLGADRLDGARGRDRLDGRRGDDVLFGGRGDDRINGGSGADDLFGDRGADLLRDGDGADVLRGGRGADVFTFVADGEVDILRDFQDGLDRIEIEGARFGALAVSALGDGRVRIDHAGDSLVVDAWADLDVRDFGREDFLFA